MTSAARTDWWLWVGHTLLLTYLQLFRPRLYRRFIRWMRFKLLQRITEISPIETSFFSSLPRAHPKHLYFEWTTDVLTPADPEGKDFDA